jgi:hypothetical protein
MATGHPCTARRMQASERLKCHALNGWRWLPDPTGSVWKPDGAILGTLFPACRTVGQPVCRRSLGGLGRRGCLGAQQNPSMGTNGQHEAVVGGARGGGVVVVIPRSCGYGPWESASGRARPCQKNQFQAPSPEQGLLWLSGGAVRVRQVPQGQTSQRRPVMCFALAKDSIPFPCP